MSSTDDYGTYGDVTLEKAYMNAECLYVPSGGETCPPSGIDPADCTKAQSEMRYLRWTYLNEGYYKGVNDQWIVQGCMDNLKREMGYRFQLISGSYPSKLSPGEAFTARIIIRNLGYAPVYNKRNVELILKNNHTNVLYLAKTDADPRFWQPLTENTIDAEIGIPAEMPLGSYSLFLNLPDGYSSLSNRVEYSIRLANQNVWDSITGYNNLQSNVDVEENSNAEKYTGLQFFQSK
jgi:hypothetical protein